MDSWQVFLLNTLLVLNAHRQALQQPPQQPPLSKIQVITTIPLGAP